MFSIIVIIIIRTFTAESDNGYDNDINDDENNYDNVTDDDTCRELDEQLQWLLMITQISNNKYTDNSNNSNKNSNNNSNTVVIVIRIVIRIVIQ